MLGAPDLLKDAMILGDKDLGAMIECHEMYIGLAYLVPGTVYPTHAHDATELYHALVGTTKWGPCERHAKPVEPDNFVYHPSAIPHWFGVSKQTNKKNKQANKIGICILTVRILWGRAFLVFNHRKRLV